MRIKKIISLGCISKGCKGRNFKSRECDNVSIDKKSKVNIGSIGDRGRI